VALIQIKRNVNNKILIAKKNSPDNGKNFKKNGGNQPPKNNITIKAELNIILLYSPKKKEQMS